MAFDIQEEESSGLKLLRLSGRLDKDSADELAGKLDLLSEANVVLVDLKALAYLSSAGIQVLLSAAQKRQREQKTMALSSVRPELRQVMEEAGFGATMKLFTDLPAALAALGPPPTNPLTDAAARLLGANAAATEVVPAAIHELADHAAALLGKKAAAPAVPTRPQREPLKETALNAPALPPVVPHDEPQPPPLPTESQPAPAAGMVGRIKGIFRR
jgi:anti-anti-sigma factor